MIEQLAVPARAVGGFVEMSLDTFRETFRRPFQFREFLDQTWMIARVSLIPTLLVSIPFTVRAAECQGGGGGQAAGDHHLLALFLLIC